MRGADARCGFALAILLSACGGGPGADTPDPSGTLDGLPEGCPDCTSAEPAAYTAKPPTDLRAFPAALMFYGDLTTQGSLAAQAVTVANHTASPVQITGVAIADELLSAQGGAEFFRFEMPPIEEPLAHGDELSIDVSFLRSSEHRSAILTISTSHPSYSKLTVELSGKYFLW